MFSDELTKRVGEFDNQAFLDSLLDKIKKQEVIDQDIVDTLYSFTDFKIFYKIMLDNKKQDEIKDTKMTFDKPNFEKM